MLFGEQTVFAKSQGTKPVQKGTWIVVVSRMVETVEEVTVMVKGKEEIKKVSRKAPKSFAKSFHAKGRLDAQRQMEDELKGTDFVLEYLYKV